MGYFCIFNPKQVIKKNILSGCSTHQQSFQEYILEPSPNYGSDKGRQVMIALGRKIFPKKTIRNYKKLGLKGSNYPFGI